MGKEKQETLWLETSLAKKKMMTMCYINFASFYAAIK